MHRKILIVTQCSARKTSRELFKTSIDFLSKIPETKEVLLRGRRKFEKHVYGVKPVTALSLYNGYLYRALNKHLVYREILAGKIDFIIISAAYGIVHALEKIKEYELKMDGKTAKYWLNTGLPKVLEEYIEKTKPKEVHGFFTKTGNYTKIYTNTNLTKLKNIVEKYTLTTPSQCKGTAKTLTTIGKTINKLITQGKIPTKINNCTNKTTNLLQNIAKMF